MQDQDQKKLRARALIQKIVYEGKTQKQAATELGISHDTAARTLTWAKQANIYAEYSQRMWDELVPLAHNAIRMELEDGNADIGIKIFQGVHLLKKDGPQSKGAVQEEEDFYGELARIRSGDVINVTPIFAPDDIRQLPIISTADPVDAADGDTVVGTVNGTSETTTGQISFGFEDPLSTATGTEDLDDADE
jgi:hypothetical protein